MGHIDSLWDPLFGSGVAAAAGGSEAVVTSWLSKGFPIADAGLGAFAYGLDILAGAIATGAAGGRSLRWCSCSACSSWAQWPVYVLDISSFF
jgi:hypothetical protein